MRAAAGAGRSEVQLVRTGADIVDQFRYCFHWQRIVDDQHEGLPRQQADRLEILDRVEPDRVLEQLRIDDDGRVRRHQQRVAVRGLTRDVLSCNVAVAAGLAFDYDGLLPRIAKFLRQL